MDFLSLDFHTEESQVIIAYLDEIPFNGFQETSYGFSAYIDEASYQEEHKSLIEELQSRFAFTFAERQVKTENWNKKWEASFKPVFIDDFCAIIADFHTIPPDYKHKIRINPKMAFGTGHHATTESMIRTMQKIDFQNKTVWDYGCGTGILAILSEQLGAKSIIANDIEEEAYKNSLENIEANNCSRIQVKQGDITCIKGTFDIILANINRNVILKSIPTLFDMLKPGGSLFISGFLNSDYQLISNKLKENHFLEMECTENNAWLCILAKK